MISILRAEERKHLRREEKEVWLTFPRESHGAPALGFDGLRVFEERRLPPRTSRRQPVREEADIVTFVHEGTLAYEDSMGRSGIIVAGEFQRMTAGPGVHYGETNTSPTEWAHVFQIWLRPSVCGLEPGHEQRRYSVAERRGVLRVVGSPDGRDGSLRLHQDSVLFSSALSSGQHVAHELVDGRCAWLHVVRGAVLCGVISLKTGDGVGLVGERVVSLTASRDSEILLLDMSESNSAPDADSPERARG